MPNLQDPFKKDREESGKLKRPSLMGKKYPRTSLKRSAKDGERLAAVQQ